MKQDMFEGSRFPGPRSTQNDKTPLRAFLESLDPIFRKCLQQNFLFSLSPVLPGCFLNSVALGPDLLLVSSRTLTQAQRLVDLDQRKMQARSQRQAKHTIALQKLAQIGCTVLINHFMYEFIVSYLPINMDCLLHTCRSHFSRREKDLLATILKG